MVEIEERNILALYTAISDRMGISGLNPDIINQNSKKEWWILINLSFEKGKGRLEIEIPRVPG